MSSMFNPDNGRTAEPSEQDIILNTLMHMMDKIDSLALRFDEFAVLRKEVSELRGLVRNSQGDRPFQPVSITINNGPDHQPRSPKDADSVDSE